MTSLGLIGPPKILGPPLDLAIPQISFFAQPPPLSPNQVSAMLLCQFLNFRPYVQIYHANFD